jgi:ATP-binding cassette subfamily B protein
MSVRSLENFDIRSELLPRLRAKAESALDADEPILAWFEPDLDNRLNYSSGLLLLTDRRLISLSADDQEVVQSSLDAKPSTVEQGTSGKDGVCPAWRRAWQLTPEIVLQTTEKGAAHSLELVNGQGLVAHWRYTPAKSKSAHHFLERCRLLRNGQSDDGAAADATEPLCPTCGLPIKGEQGLCENCGALQRSRAGRSLLRLMTFVRRHAWAALLGVFLTIAGTAASMVPPYLTRPMLDDVLIPYSLHRFDAAKLYLIPWLLGGLAVASIASWALNWGRTYVVAWLSERIAADLRNETYAHLQRMSLQFFGGKRTGDLISRVSSDSDRICSFIQLHLLDFASDVLMLVMVAVILLSIDARLALATLVPLPLIAYLVQNVRNRLRRGFHVGNRAWSEMTSVLADTIPGIRVVKAFAQERREVTRFARANDRVLAANDRVNRLWSFFGPLVTLLTDGGLLVIWIVGVWQVCNGRLTVGTLTLFLAYISRFYVRLESMSRFLSMSQRAAVAAQRIFSVMDREVTVAEPLHPVSPGRLRGRIEFRDVGFRYGTRSVIEHIDLAIEPGEMIGLVGPSGSGKTTLVNLACRFYDVAEGAVLVDGTDVRSFPIQEYRRHIGLVLQEPFLFYGTIAENIAYGRPDATREEVLAAAKAARAHEFILRLPDGYDSLVGERGQSLSGGERQRISIARALLIDPRILILDEATSSVDTETEREIQLALDNLIQGRTTIAIAHRLSTLARANRLVVMERGHIVEVGSQQELLDRDGLYARLYRAQLDSPVENGSATKDYESVLSLPAGRDEGSVL